MWGVIVTKLNHATWSKKCVCKFNNESDALNYIHNLSFADLEELYNTTGWRRVSWCEFVDDDAEIITRIDEKKFRIYVREVES